MSYWLFQGNPKYYRILEAIRDLEQIPWLVTRYAKDIAVGDGVLVWVCGEKRGYMRSMCEIDIKGVSVPFT